MNRTDSGTSLASNNEKLLATAMGDSTDGLPPIDDEEIEQVQTAFSDMIDQTCVHGPVADGNILEHTYVPKDGLEFCFRSIVPKQDSLKERAEPETARQLFKYDHREDAVYAFKVLDRRTNRLTYEQMPKYQRYGMRLLFSGPVQRELLHTRAIKKFFSRETIRLGKAFDDPKSRKHIPAFVKMYEINLNELCKPDLASYQTFNEFFYRQLKEEVRPIAHPDQDDIVVSAADCRLMLFDNIHDATRIWIKGHHFSLKHLFDDDKLAEEFDGGSIAVFRLAPVDYHRFHSPISGKIGRQMKQITGTYYTVNPVAIQENLDVLTRNQRTLITIENDKYEKVAFVAIGALLVGSVNFTVEPNQTIKKGQEIGYFAYGGSTIVSVFKAGMIKWDDDIQHNSNNTMETLVRVGEQIGQQRTDQERQEYLGRYARFSQTNATINNLVTCFRISNLNN